MYGRILLASDGTRDSLVALREGALLARACQAQVFLLIIDAETPGTRVADGVYPRSKGEEPQVLLAFGLTRLARLGLRAAGEVVAGEPAAEIGACAQRFGADLVVVGHRRQSLLERWWSGAASAYIVDHVKCSVLIARCLISDAAFEARLERETEGPVR